MNLFSIWNQKTLDNHRKKGESFLNYFNVILIVYSFPSMK